MSEVSQILTPPKFLNSISKFFCNSEELSSGIVTTNCINSAGVFFWTAKAEKRIDIINNAKSCFIFLRIIPTANIKNQLQIIARFT